MADDKIHGRSGGGDSGGGAYPNPHSGKDKGGADGFMGMAARATCLIMATGSSARRRSAKIRTPPPKKRAPPTIEADVRHCERSEAIQRRLDCRVAVLLAMTKRPAAVIGKTIGAGGR
jgi:hypothetical protein